jgi:hypothetical protein
MRNIALVLLLACQFHVAQAANLIFDDLPRGKQVGNQYASQGIFFSPYDFGVQDGIANGDPGGWVLNGTSGPAFLGFNSQSIVPFRMVLDFTAHVSSFSVDASRANGTTTGQTFTLAGLMNGVVVESKTYGFGPINTWLTASITGEFDRVDWFSEGKPNASYAFGVDNVNFTFVPEPSSLTLALGAGVLWLFRRRRNRA